MDIASNIQISTNATQTSNVKASSLKSNENDNSKSFKEVLSASTKSSSANDSNSKIVNDSTVNNTNSVSQKDDTSNGEIKKSDNISAGEKDSTKITAKSQNDNVGVEEKTVENDDKETVSVKDVEENLETILAELLQALLVKADATPNNEKANVTDTKTQEGTAVAVDLRTDSSIQQALQQLVGSSNVDLKEFAESMLNKLKEAQGSDAKLLNSNLQNNAEQLLQLLNTNSQTNDTKEVDANLLSSIEKLLGTNQLTNNSGAGNENRIVGLQEQFKDAFNKISKLVEQVNNKGENTQQLVNLKETLQTIKNVLQNVDENLTAKDQNSLFKQVVAEINNNLAKIDEANNSKNDSSSNSNQFNNKSKDQNSFLTTDSKESSDNTVLSKILNNDNESSKFSTIANRLVDFKPIQNLEKLEAPVVNKYTMAQDIVKSVKYMQSNDMRELTVKVNPGTLGEITIKLVAQGESMKANLQISSKDTYNLINSQEIKNALNNENIKVTEVNISLYNEDTTFYRNESSFGEQLSKGSKGNRDDSNQTDTNSSADAIDEDESEDMGLSSLNIFV